MKYGNYLVRTGQFDHIGEIAMTVMNVRAEKKGKFIQLISPDGHVVLTTRKSKVSKTTIEELGQALWEEAQIIKAQGN